MSRSLSYWVATYRANLKVSIASMLQYRMAVLIWAVWGFVGPMIMLAVWAATSQSRGGAISNRGVTFTQADFAAYYMTFLVVGHLTMSWDAFEFAWRIRDGSLSARLLKPLHPMHSDIASNIAFKLVTSSMLIPIWIIMIWLLRPTAPASWLQLFLAIPAIILAWLVRYMFNYALAVVAFWTTRVEALNQLYFTFDSFLSGSIAPLALMPALLGTVAYYSPFRSMGSFPVELVLGRVPPAQILPGFMLQVFWLAAGALLLRKVWAAGIKQFSAVGA
jgi:ABC-2 type transport system permease protein